MANNSFYVPELKNNEAWLDYRFLEGGYGWRGDRSLSSIKKIILHHTVTNQYQDADREFREIWQHRRYGGTPYHFLISSEEVSGYAKVGYMGDVGSIRAHAVNAKGKDGLPANKGNNYSLGISFMGDHRDSMPTDAMLKSAKLLIEELMIHDARFDGIQGVEDVLGHGYWDFTWCPDGVEGKILKKLILDINLNNMGLSHDHPAIKGACDWDKALMEKAKETPLADTIPSEIVTVKTEENLERNANIGEVLLLISRYHYNLRSLYKGELEKKIAELDITDEVVKDVRKAIAEILDPEVLNE